ncbi:MAG: hypothetical protein LAT63_12755 [Marinobacter sp.]|nr:hypothetical protein [Marinobacter sp.]
MMASVQYQGRCYRAVLALALLTLFSACASLPDPELGDSDAAPARAKPAERPQPCAWGQQRGVAELLAIDTDREPPLGTWQFFPGDDLVFLTTPAGADVGDEYRAVIQRPLSGPCDQPRLRLVAPLH